MGNKYITLIKKHGMKKGFLYLKQSFEIKRKEKIYQSHGIKIKYIYEKHDSDRLIVVFSAFSEWGVKARYNYIKTLQDVKVNKLWVLDEYGPYNRGCYYLGKSKGNEIYDSVKELIIHLKTKYKIEETIYIGSSKGGYAALNFGFDDENGKISVIAGAPQYLLGTYLTCNTTNKPLLELFEYLTGKTYNDEVQEEIEELDHIISDKLKQRSSMKKDMSCDVYLHYSDKEHTYLDNIIYLVQDLKKTSINLQEEVLHYSKHGDVAKFFPEFLIKSIEEILLKREERTV